MAKAAFTDFTRAGETELELEANCGGPISTCNRRRVQ